MASPLWVTVNAQQWTTAVGAAFDASDSASQGFGCDAKFCDGDPATRGAVDLMIPVDPA